MTMTNIILSGSKYDLTKITVLERKVVLVDGKPEKGQEVNWNPIDLVKL